LKNYRFNARLPGILNGESAGESMGGTSFLPEELPGLFSTVVWVPASLEHIVLTKSFCILCKIV